MDKKNTETKKQSPFTAENYKRIKREIFMRNLQYNDFLCDDLGGKNEQEKRD